MERLGEALIEMKSLCSGSSAVSCETSGRAWTQFQILVAELVVKVV